MSEKNSKGLSVSFRVDSGYLDHNNRVITAHNHEPPTTLPTRKSTCTIFMNRFLARLLRNTTQSRNDPTGKFLTTMNTLKSPARANYSTR